MIQDAGALTTVDFAILADLVILLLVLILPLVFHGVERNLAFPAAHRGRFG